MSPRHLVVLNWQFPPNKGIGGRRTSLLVKHWLKMGYHVSVICQKPGTETTTSDWIDTETMSKIEYHFIDQKNDYNALFFEKGLLAKIKIKILGTYFKFFGKGNPIDETYFCGQTIFKAIQSIDQNKNIDFIFTSGAPFYLGYWASLFKREKPHVKLWCDFRDPWTHAINYGIPQLSPHQRKKDQFIHQEIESNADFISAPYPEILDEFTLSAGHKIEIPHFHDQLKIENLDRLPLWIYAGEIYEGTSKDWEKAIASTTEKCSHNQLHIYSRHIDRLKQFEAVNHVVLHPDIGEKVKDELRRCSAIIISLGEHNKDFFTTKFFDHLTYQKPYLYIGPEGKVLQFIRNNGLGDRIENWHPEQFSYNATFAEKLWSMHSAEKWARTIIHNLEGRA